MWHLIVVSAGQSVAVQGAALSAPSLLLLQASVSVCGYFCRVQIRTIMVRRVWDLETSVVGFRVQGLGFRIQVSGFQI